MRKSFPDTVQALRELGLVGQDQRPSVPEAMPQYDDTDRSGFSIFRMGLDGTDFSNLELPRTFFSRSELANCDFSGSNLSESNLTWNDFHRRQFLARRPQRRRSQGVDFRWGRFFSCRPLRRGPPAERLYRLPFRFGEYGRCNADRVFVGCAESVGTTEECDCMEGSGRGTSRRVGSERRFAASGSAMISDDELARLRAERRPAAISFT